MPMDRSRTDEIVQTPAPKQTEAPVTVDPEVNYDPFRGSGGEYEIDEEGVRVQVEPPTEPVPLPPDPDAPVMDNTLPEPENPEAARNTAPDQEPKQ